MKTSMLKLSALFITFGLVFITACENDDPGPGDSNEGPLFAVNYTVDTPDGTTSFVNLSNSLEEELQVQNAIIEFPGNSMMYDSPLVPEAIFMGSAESPTITRYDISEDGSLVEGQTLSFANFGLARAPRFSSLVAFASDEEAFIVDIGAAQVISWNPKEMTTGQSIDLGNLERDGIFPADPFRVVIDAGKLYIPLGWFRFNDEIVLPFSEVAIIDVQTKTATLIREDRVAGLRSISRSQSGDIYVAGTVNTAAVFNAVNENIGNEPAIVRIRQGEDRFDPDYLVKLNDLAGGRLSADIVTVGDELLFHAYHEEEVPIVEGNPAIDIVLAIAWRFYAISLSELDQPGASAREITEWEFTNGFASFITGDNRIFLVDQKENHSSLIDFTAANSPTETVRINTGGVFFRNIKRLL